MIKNLLMGLAAVTLLTACDDWWEGISNSGSGSEQPATQVVSLPTASSSSSAADTSGDTSASGDDAESESQQTASESDTSAEETTASSSETRTAAETAPKETVEPETRARSDDKCGAGKYGFVTTKDNDTHFHATFESGGKVRYFLRGSPTGKWSLNGDRMDVYGPFKMPGRKYTTLNFTVTSRSSDCKVREALGKSPGGQDLAIRRR